MWGSLIRIQKLIQKSRPPIVFFSKAESKFSANPPETNKYKIRLININLCLMIFASYTGLNRIISGDNKSSQSNPVKELTPEELRAQTGKTILGSVLCILYLTLETYCLVAAWTFHYRTISTVIMMNQARGMYLDRVKNPGKIPGAPSKKESALFGALLYIMMLTCIFGWFAVTMFPVASSNNPGYVILTWFLPEKTFQERPYLIKILSIMYIGITGYYGVIPIMQAFTYVTALLFEMTYILRRAYNYDDNFKDKWNPNTFLHEWMIYAENILFLRGVNQFGTCLYPGIMMTAFSINVATTTVCMKFHHELPPMMLYLLLGFDGVVAVATCIVQSLCVIGKEESESFHEYWKPRLFSKMARKRLKACQPTPVWLGPFFIMQRSTLLSTVNEVVNMVVSLLLADQ